MSVDQKDNTILKTLVGFVIVPIYLVAVMAIVTLMMLFASALVGLDPYSLEGTLIACGILVLYIALEFYLMMASKKITPAVIVAGLVVLAPYVAYMGLKYVMHVGLKKVRSRHRNTRSAMGTYVRHSYASSTRNAFGCILDYLGGATLNVTYPFNHLYGR